MPKTIPTSNAPTPYSRPQNRGIFTRLRSLFTKPKPTSPLGPPIVLSGDITPKKDVSINDSRITYHTPQKEPLQEDSIVLLDSKIDRSLEKNENPNDILKHFFENKGDAELSDTDITEAISLINQAVERGESLIDINQFLVPSSDSTSGLGQRLGIDTSLGLIPKSRERLPKLKPKAQRDRVASAVASAFSQVKSPQTEKLLVSSTPKSKTTAHAVSTMKESMESPSKSPANSISKAFESIAQAPKSFESEPIIAKSQLTDKPQSIEKQQQFDIKSQPAVEKKKTIEQLPKPVSFTPASKPTQQQKEHVVVEHIPQPIADEFTFTLPQSTSVNISGDQQKFIEDYQKEYVF